MADGIHILLVEDNPGDVRLTREALRGAKVANDLQVVGDGEAAIDYLRRRGRFANAPRPDIVLLDLNLPRLMGGRSSVTSRATRTSPRSRSSS